MNRSGLTRRGFLGATAAGTILVAGSAKASSADRRDGGFPGLPKDGTVRDRLWIWGGAPGATNDEWGHAASRMTAAEAAFYMGIPNLFLIRHKGRPKLEEYGYQLLKARRVEGLIFLEHGVCDIGLETVKWTKQWIAKVGEQRLIH